MTVKTFKFLLGVYERHTKKEFETNVVEYDMEDSIPEFQRLDYAKNRFREVVVKRITYEPRFRSKLKDNWYIDGVEL